MRVAHLRHGESHSLLLLKLFSVSLDLVHALTGSLAVVLLRHRVGSELLFLCGQTLLVSPVDVGYRGGGWHDGWGGVRGAEGDAQCDATRNKRETKRVAWS